MNVIDLSGRRAVVTGGASGIGLATARRLLDAKAAAVTLWDRDAGALALATESFGSNRAVYARAVDVTDPGAVVQAAREAECAMGGIDILVNSAGITGPNTTTWEYPLDDWRAVIDINLNGIFYCYNIHLRGIYF